ncbi:hypothetical protein V496_08763 [Pseudogymnoascus sp. VKM F-4515 (FW-2607)]|nr:hypothetical protein V496_08763 [Pseudogymnoascus sp. VKM F-4515 (FW-2607)]
MYINWSTSARQGPVLYLTTPAQNGPLPNVLDSSRLDHTPYTQSSRARNKRRVASGSAETGSEYEAPATLWGYAEYKTL